MAIGATAIRAGQAFVELVLKDGPFQKGLRAAERRLKSWGAGVTAAGASIGAIGGAITAPLAAAVKLATDMGSALQDASDRTGVSVEALSELGFAADQSATSMEDVEVALKKMSKLVVTAGEGSKEAASTITALGLSVADLRAMKPEDAFTAIGDAISQIENPTERSAAAVDAFGKSGTRLLPLFKDGAAGLDEMRKAARDLGLVWSGEDAASAEEFGDTLDVLWKQLKMSAAQVGMALIPELKKLVSLTGPILRQVIDWVKANRGLIVTVGTVAAGLVVVGGAIAGLGLALSGIGAAIGAVAGVISFILSPLGLVIVALGAAVYLLYRFTSLGEIVGETWAGIADAIAAGDLEAAMEIAWAGIKLAWTSGINFLQAQWIGFRDWFLDVTDAMAIVAVNTITRAMALIGDAQKVELGRNAAVNAILNAGIQRRARSGSEIAGLGDATAAAGIDAMTVQELARLRAEAAASRVGSVRGGPGIGDALGRGTAAGTFSAAAAAGLGVASSAAERTANATEATARGVKELRDRLVFD